MSKRTPVDCQYFLKVQRDAERRDSLSTWRGKLFRETEGQQLHLERPLITVACQEDLTATDLVGRYLLKQDATVWQDGPLTTAVRTGAFCYRDEIVEARKDSIVLIHSLTDYRRTLPVDKTGELIEAHDGFLLVISYNPGYQSILKDLKPSTRQRFISLDFDYPSEELETGIICHESGVSEDYASRPTFLGVKIRNLREHGFEEGVRTRLLIYAGALIANGIDPRRASATALVHALSDDAEVQQAIADIVDVIWP